jgi:tetratricopeptide (TPR) repeat protein
VVWSSAALAQSKPRRPAAAEADRVARAEAAFKRAGAAFDAGKLETALANYQESYALWPRPRTLLNLGVVLRRLGRVAEAANLLAEYIEHEAADAARVEAARKTLAELDAEVGRLQITALGEGPVELDGELVEAPRLARPLRVTSGRHRLSQDGDSLELAIAKGQEMTLEIGRPRAAAPPPPPPAPPVTAAPVVTARAAPGQPTRFYLWTGVATVLAGGATGLFALRLRGQQEDLDEILENPAMHEYGAAIRARDRTDRTALYTNVGLGVTAAGLVATGVLFFLHDGGDGDGDDDGGGDGAEQRRSARRLAPRVTPSVSTDGDGATLSLSGRW